MNFPILGVLGVNFPILGGLGGSKNRFWGQKSTFRPLYPGNRKNGPNPHMFYFLFLDPGGPGAGPGGAWGVNFPLLGSIFQFLARFLIF